jgi:hypothetical protein
MPTKQYSDFIEMSPTFESVVDIDADSRNINLWREYIVGDDMDKMMEVLCQSLNNEGPDMRRSFWLEGTYGTGKSYAAILIKHLIEDAPDVVRDYMIKNPRMAPYANRFMKCRSKGDYLVIWKTGCTGIRDGNTMLMEAENAIRNALTEKFGSKADYGEESLQNAVRQQVHSPFHNWSYILETTNLGDDYDTVEQLQNAIDAGNLDALQKTAAVIRQCKMGLVDSLETFKKWIAAIIENNGLSQSGIIFFWDEFTEYVANSDDQTILQQLSEFSKVKPLFMFFVIHRTAAMVERITPERYQLITHRFHEVEFHINSDAAFDLIAGSINIRNGMSANWKEERKTVIKNIKPFLPDMVGLDDTISEKIDQLCPMHPMTIRLLARVAENYAASQRTMFRFMKDQSTPDQGFVGYIHRYGPDDQANWLTPEWLWDYFFTRESDFSDKDTKAAEYIRHYEESRHLVENDENALRVFKSVMLLMALMSSTKGIYSGKRSRDGISATEECLNTCLAGVMNKHAVHDLLNTMADSKILILDEDSHGNVRLQLPFRGSSDMDFSSKLSANDKKHSRYMMFSKDGDFAKAFEQQAIDDNDAASKRMKIAVCCAETNSINTRLGEITKELDKAKYKLGLLLVTVQSDSQAVSIQTMLQAKAAEINEPRLTIALVKTPLTDEKRAQWLNTITKMEMAAEAGQTGAVNQYKSEATTLISSWVGNVVSAGKIIAYNNQQVFSNQYGMANLRKTIRVSVQDEIFPNAPENIVVTATAYKPCNDGAPIAGIQHSGINQFVNVLNALKQANVLDLNTIEEMSAASGSKTAQSIAALAQVVRTEMESGHKVNLGDLWNTLQQPPFGYYDTIACGVLLGYVFSCYKQSKYTWTDSAQSPHILAEATLGKMVLDMCKGKMTTDYLSAGSITWQNFSDYLVKIFNLSTAQLAEQTTGYRNVREAVAQCGTPFWALKYIPSDAWNNEDLRDFAGKVIDDIQVFIAQEGDIEGAMSSVLQHMQGRGKIRVMLAKYYQDKNAMAAIFRSFLFDASVELKAIATTLEIQPEELSDKLHAVMQGAIYTWTEEQVVEKLDDVASEYKYLEAVGKVQNTVYHSIEAATKDLANLFKYFRVSLSAIEQLKKKWYPALMVLNKIATNGAHHLSPEERSADIATLTLYGAYAKDCLMDAKPVLHDILSAKGIDCTLSELDTIYAGLKDSSYEASLTQFDKDLNGQISRISQARNKVLLQETWISISGNSESVKQWCNDHGAPLMWIVPKDMQKAFATLIDVQQNGFAADSAVVNALNLLRIMDGSILSDDAKIKNAFLAIVGIEYADIWQSERSKLLAKAKIKIGNDMSAWATADLSVLQGILKQEQQEKAKTEKLTDAKKTVSTLDDHILRARVASFLDAHPQFCDDFTK